MIVSDLTIKALNSLVTGDGAPSRRMSGPDLIKFFNSFGFCDEYSHQNGGLPNAWSRNEYSFKRLKELNGKREFQQLVEALADCRNNDNPEVVANEIREFIKHDGYSFNKDESGIYRIDGEGLNDPAIIEAHFKNIKMEISESIRKSEIAIWVAVAWFTDKDLANELRTKHRSGLNVQVIVNDDETTNGFGLNFATKNIEYHKVAPDSAWGKQLMHNKFCIIDFKTVIHGSYNWTSNARYNNESITITDSRDLAMEFSKEFVQLKGMNNS